MSQYVGLAFLLIILIVVLINMFFLIWFYNTYSNDKSTFDDTLDELGNMAKIYLADDSGGDTEPTDDCCRRNSKKDVSPIKKSKKYKNIFEFTGNNCE